jgi:hypothetical protein
METSDYEVIFAFPNGNEDVALCHDCDSEQDARWLAACTVSRRYDEDNAETFAQYIVEVNRL